ncbi:MAG: hypothetical protein FJ295_17400 [Planctomycetes bacterium]|nr:hypothetical protein [Planctomycetota bacterium]
MAVLRILSLGMLITQVVTAQPTLSVSVGERQLFLDDHGVAQISGLTRTMHQPTKRGPVLKPDVPSDGSLLELRSAPQWDQEQQVYKMFYCAMPMDDHRLIGMALAISKDGLHWDKPNLGQQIEIRGSTNNNRIAVEHKPGVRDTFFLNVVYDPDDPDADGRFKALYGDEYRIPIVSRDGISWNKLAVPRIASQDESSLVYDRKQRRFLAWLKTDNKYGRAHSLSISTDFRTWSSPQLSFGADDEDQPLALRFICDRIRDRGLSRPVYVDDDPALGKPVRPGPRTWLADCYYIGVFPYETLYIGFPTMFFPTGVDHNGNNCDGFDLIQLACTRDLLTWTRLGDRQPFIPPGRIDDGLVGVWDRMQMFATTPIVRDDELWIYYSALKWRDDPYAFNSDRSRRDPKSLSAEERADQAEGMGAICLATLRRDGFVSLDAAETPGTITTKPFPWPGGRLMANVATRDLGELRVDVVNAEDTVIATSHPLKGDQPRGEFRWKQEPPESLRGQPVSLRFTLRESSFYAWWTDGPN